MLWNKSTRCSDNLLQEDLTSWRWGLVTKCCRKEVTFQADTWRMSRSWSCRGPGDRYMWRVQCVFEVSGWGIQHQGTKRCPLKKKGWPARKQAASSPVSWIFRMGEGRAEGIRDWMAKNFGHSCEMLRCCSVAKSCLTLCDHINCRTWGFPVLHYLPEFAQTHVQCVDDAI